MYFITQYYVYFVLGNHTIFYWSDTKFFCISVDQSIENQ